MEVEFPNLNGRNTNTRSSIKGSKKFSHGHNNNWNILNSNYSSERAFGSLVLNAWRKQREDAHLGAKKISKYKYNYLKAKETIRFLDSVILVEKEHNEKLFNELKTYSNELIVANNTNAKLRESITNLESRINIMNDTLSTKNQEYQNILGKFLTSQENIKKMHAHRKRIENAYKLSQNKVVQLSNKNIYLARSLKDLKVVVRRHSDELNRKQATIVSTNNELSEIKSEILTSKNHIESLLQIASVIDTLDNVNKANQNRVDTVSVVNFQYLFQLPFLLLQRFFGGFRATRVALSPTINQIIANEITLHSIRNDMDNFV